MTTQYAVQVDQQAVAEAQALFEFVGGNTDEALRVAINATLPKTRTASSRAIRQQVRLSASYVRDRLATRKATRKALTGKLGTPSRGLLLSRFSTNAQIAGDKVSWIKPPLVPPRGIRVKVKPEGAPKEVKGDGDTLPNKPFFLVINGGQNVGIAARLRGQRSKIKIFAGPSLSQVFDDVRDDITPDAAATLQAELLDAMRYILARKYPPEPQDG